MINIKFGSFDFFNLLLFLGVFIFSFSFLFKGMKLRYLFFYYGGCLVIISFSILLFLKMLDGFSLSAISKTNFRNENIETIN